jgi:NAD(P)-dependent dehydrogenase (short-subunit alcohol dehydrogenase family)
MDKPLTGKVALVAGATRGAGRGIYLSIGNAGRVPRRYRARTSMIGSRVWARSTQKWPN